MGKRESSGAVLRGRDGKTAELTCRQFEVLELAARGLGYKHIAAYLGISPRTVEDRFREMRERTGTGNKSELIALAVAAGVVRPSDADELKGAAPFLHALRMMTAAPDRNCLAAGHVLDPESARPGGSLVGYAGASATGQMLDRQLTALRAAGCVRVFAEKDSGENAEWPELGACLDHLLTGDTLVVTRLDRLPASLADLITVIAELHRRGVGFKSLYESLDTTNSGGRLTFHVFAALAEFISDLIADGADDGLPDPLRPPTPTPEQLRYARDLLARPDNTVTSIARLLGVSRATIYKYVPEVTP
jgi:DNA invertase Pin-like site-specific DNA recombinase